MTVANGRGDMLTRETHQMYGVTSARTVLHCHVRDGLLQQDICNTAERHRTTKTILFLSTFKNYTNVHLHQLLSKNFF